MRIIKNSHTGFTLTEMLVVAVTVSIVSLAIYAVFNSGLKIWQRVNRDIPEAEVGIFFDRLSLDLKNALRFKGINFQGQREALGFATIVNSRGMEKSTVGEVSYAYNSGEKNVGRIQRDFSQVFSKEDLLYVQVLGGVESMSFRYYYYDKDTKEYLWKDEWQAEDLPLAVRAEIEFHNGKEKNTFTETVSIPASS